MTNPEDSMNCRIRLHRLRQEALDTTRLDEYKFRVIRVRVASRLPWRRYEWSERNCFIEKRSCRCNNQPDPHLNPCTGYTADGELLHEDRHTGQLIGKPISLLSEMEIEAALRWFIS